MSIFPVSNLPNSEGSNASTAREALPGVDLVVPTIGNVPELRRLLESLVAQSYSPLRVVVVDKSSDKRISVLLAEYRDELDILHLPTAPCGVSRAVNIGLEYVSAEVVGVPDDDCWYPSGFLWTVVRRFSTDPGLAGLSVRQVDEDRRPSHGRWARRPGRVTRTNVWGRGVGPGIFYRRLALEAVGPFDETLGVGSGVWEAGLETDLLIRVVNAGYRVEYEPSLFVFHPGPESGKKGAYTVDRWRSYGTAMGHVMRKHRFPLHSALYHCARPLVGAPIALLTGDVDIARRRLATGRGRFSGWLASSDRAPMHQGFASGAGSSTAASLDLPSMDLVVPTVRRTTELRRMLATAGRQAYPSLRVIVVDQNPDATAESVIDEFDQRLEIVHARLSPPGASRSRNHGVAQATAEIVGFPDDDCWYPDGVLRLIGRRFANDSGLAGLSVMLVDDQLRPSNGRWATKPERITRTNVWGRAVTSGMFVRLAALQGTGGFDETLGPASGAWEAGEETDLLIRLVDAGHRIEYDPTLYVHHPDPERDLHKTYPLERWRAYAASMGHVMRKHRYPLHTVAYHCGRPLAGVVVSAFCGNFARARTRLAIAIARAEGWARSPSR